ncbi:MAG: FAD-binding protein, partial [Gemmatimonadota bacterium]
MTSPTDLPLEPLATRLGADRVERDVPLAPYTTFRIGGPTDLLYRARSPDELVSSVQAARELGVPVFVLGVGANVLIGDRGFRGLVVRNEIEGIEFMDDVRVRAGSGVIVYHDLIQATVSRGLGGL